jgi:hypothetical protein
MGYPDRPCSVPVHSVQLLTELQGGGQRGDWEGKRGHHLADPGQWHDEYSRARTRLLSCRVASSRSSTRRRFSLRRRRIGSDPHQSPFWIKAVRPLLGGAALGPWFSRTPENRRCPTKVQVVRRGGGRPGALDPKKSKRARPTPVGLRVHRSLARCPAGAGQPQAGSMAGAFRSQALLRGVGGMPRRPIGSGGLRPTPFAGSPGYPQTGQAKARPTSKSVPSRSM